MNRETLAASRLTSCGPDSKASVWSTELYVGQYAICTATFNGYRTAKAPCSRLHRGPRLAGASPEHRATSGPTARKGQKRGAVNRIKDLVDAGSTSQSTCRGIKRHCVRERTGEPSVQFRKRVWRVELRLLRNRNFAKTEAIQRAIDRQYETGDSYRDFATGKLLKIVVDQIEVRFVKLCNADATLKPRP